MAQYAYTFTSGDVVTPTKLNNARTVSDIVNADISATAAIAGTKIAPDFGSQDVKTTGGLLLGHGSKIDATFAAGGGAATPELQVAGTSVAESSVGLFNYSSVGSSAGQLLLAKSTSGTTASHTAVTSGNTVGDIGFLGSDGTNFVSAARIFAQVDGTPGTNDMPGRLIFSTTADGASSVTERMRITQAGNVGIANASPTEKLHVTGNIKASGYIDADTSFRGQASDSAAAPSFTWTGDTNTGMFRPAADTIAFSEGGSEVMRINSDGRVGIGTTSPSHKLDVDGTINATLYRVNDTIVVGARRTGWAAPTGTADRTTFNTGTVTLSELAQRVHALIDDLTDHGLIGS